MKIEELHDHLFEILCTVDDICKKENIKYFLDSGTEIGAVREHDFIPWDDDLDIAVLSEDYPAFKQAMEKHLPPFMHIEEPTESKVSFENFLTRIYDERYDLKDIREGNAYSHPGADVFVFSKTSSSFFERKKKVFITKVLYGMSMAYRYRIPYSKYSVIEKVQVRILSSVGKLLKPNTIYKLWWKSSNRHSDESPFFRFTSNYGINNLLFFPEEDFKGTAYFMIRGRIFPVPSGYHQQLTQQYGDYMIPHCDTKRYTQHLHLESGLE